MFKITLSPLDERAVHELAKRRGLTVEDLISFLIREESAIELTRWREPLEQSKPAQSDQVVHDAG